MSGKSDSKLMGLRAADTVGDWIVVRKLGKGGCGAVFEVRVKNGDQKKRLAMKVESRDLDHNDQLLRAEATILKRMQFSGHVPVYIAAGRTAIFNFLLMELLGKSLSELHKEAPHRQFTMPTVLKIALQALNALRDLHSVYFIHRDVKPANFATGLKNVNVLFILDFGLSRQFATYDPKTKVLKLRKARARASFRGTVAYCSVNVHKHMEQGRHDDLWVPFSSPEPPVPPRTRTISRDAGQVIISFPWDTARRTPRQVAGKTVDVNPENCLLAVDVSMMYMLIEFIAGRLPWKGLDRKETAVIKQTISNRRLLQGCPKQFGAILQHLSKLRYHYRPDYEQIERLLVLAIQRRKIDRKAPFEWGLPKAREYLPEKKGKSSEQKGIAQAAAKTLDKAIKRKRAAASLEATPLEYRIEATQCA